MPEEIAIKRQDSETLDEIEKSSSTKCYAKLIHALQDDPENFGRFKSLKKVESNVYHLAKEYLNNYKKSLVPFNEEIHEISERFVNDSSTYDFIKRFDKSALKNKLLVKMMISIVKDCVDSAFQLAKYREKERHSADIEHLKLSLARIERSNARREAKLDRLLAKNGLDPNNDQLVSSQSTQQTVQRESIVQQPPHSNVSLQKEVSKAHFSPQCDARKRTRTSVPQADAPMTKQRKCESSVPTLQRKSIDTPPRDSWRFVSEDDCRKLFANNPLGDKFIRAYLPKLFSAAELLLPLKDVSLEKKQEFLEVLSHFYGRSSSWDETFNASMNKIRSHKRQRIFKDIGKSKGYGISSNGKEYYYKLSTRMCFKNDECHPSSNLRTRSVGNISVPEICGNFKYILLIEKQGAKADLQMLFANGNIEKI